MTAMKVTRGKPIDLKAVRHALTWADTRAKAQAMREYFDTLGDFEAVGTCPVCDHMYWRLDARLWGSAIGACQLCGHAWCDRVPSPRALDAYYKDEATKHYNHYTGDDSEARIREVCVPKLEWAIESYADAYGRKPKTLLDVGSGSGHFLEAARRAGLGTFGHETNPAMREWCQVNYKIYCTDSLADAGQRFDLVTSFNVIEHVPRPREFLRDMKRLGSKESMIVLETPRYDSIGVEVEKSFPEYAGTGMLVPYSHLHLFSKASLMHLFRSEGLEPSAAWFFGQDAKDILYRMGHTDDEVFERFSVLQAAIDKCEAGNLMIFAAANKGES